MGRRLISLEGGNRGTAWAQQSGALELFGISRLGRRESAGSPRATSMSTGESDSPLEESGFELLVPPSLSAVGAGQTERSARRRACPSRGGLTVRIHFAPAESRTNVDRDLRMGRYCGVSRTRVPALFSRSAPAPDRCRDVIANAEHILDQIAGAAKEIAHQGLCAKADRNAHHAGAGEQRQNIEPQRR